MAPNAASDPAAGRRRTAIPARCCRAVRWNEWYFACTSRCMSRQRYCVARGLLAMHMAVLLLAGCARHLDKGFSNSSATLVLRSSKPPAPSRERKGTSSAGMADAARKRTDEVNLPARSRPSSDVPVGNLGNSTPGSVSTSGVLPPTNTPVWGVVIESRHPSGEGNGASSVPVVQGAGAEHAAAHRRLATRVAPAVIAGVLITAVLWLPRRRRW